MRNTTLSSTPTSTHRVIRRFAPVASLTILLVPGACASDADSSTGQPSAGASGAASIAEAPAPTPVPTTAPAVIPPPTTTAATTTAATTPAATTPATTIRLPAEPRVLFEWFPDGEDAKSVVVSDASLAADPVRIVPVGEGAALHSDWSHDGERLTWEVLAGDTASAWIADADGSDATEVAVCPGAPCVQMAWPSFSPDDEQLLVTRYDLAPDGDWGQSHLVLVDLTTGAQTTIASTADGTTAFYVASMSPDGARVAATLETYTDATQQARSSSVIVVVDTDPATTDPPVAVTDPALAAGYPDWHPSDDRILFASWNLDAYQSGDEASQLYTVAPDGSGLTQVTDVDYSTSRARPGFARWTPAGDRIIAAASIRESGQLVTVTLVYVDPATGAITDTGMPGSMPSLQPRP